MSINPGQSSASISYTVLSDGGGYTQSGSAGAPLSPLDAKLVEIRSYHINWESYFQNEVITASDHEFISKFDHKSSKQKNQMLAEEGERVM